MAAQLASINDLPLELLNLVLEPLETSALLSVLPTSKPIFDAASTVLHQRLRRALTLPELEVILECYHEGIRLSAPTLACRYLQTVEEDCAFPDRWRGGDGGGRRAEDDAGDPRRWHTWFEVRSRPVESRTWTHPRHTTPATPPSGRDADRRREQEEGEDTPSLDITLGEGDTEIDLITRPIIGRDPKPGIFVTHAPVYEAELKVTRDWLSEASGPLEETSASRRADQDRSMLWSGQGREVGVRFRVRAEAAERMPVLVGADDKPAVSYTLEYDGMVIRSVLLLNAVEQVFSNHREVGGKALVLAIPS